MADSSPPRLTSPMRFYTRNNDGHFTEESIDDDTVAFFKGIVHNNNRGEANTSRIKRLQEHEKREASARQPIQTTVTATMQEPRHTLTPAQSSSRSATQSNNFNGQADQALTACYITRMAGLTIQDNTDSAATSSHAERRNNQTRP